MSPSTQAGARDSPLRFEKKAVTLWEPHMEKTGEQPLGAERGSQPVASKKTGNSPVTTKL